MSTRILIVDDYALFRRSARQMLESGGFVVVGEADDGASAIAAVRELRPEVVLLDVQLPDFDGFEVARRLAVEANAPVVVLTSVREASDYRGRLAGAPIRGFIAKTELSQASITELLECQS